MADVKNKCIICRRKARSLCSPLGGMICSACCGSKRGDKINCPADCRHYPFSPAGYDLLRQLEGGIIEKLYDYSRKHVGPAETNKIVKSMVFEDEPDEFALEKAAGSAVEYMMFLRKDKNNRTPAEIWKDGGWDGLSNDERMMLEFRMAHPYATVIEVQRVIDSRTVECIDLFDPDRGVFILLDRTLTDSISRYTRLFSWLHYYPHCGRLANDALEVPDMIFDEFMSAIGKRLEKESKENPGLSVKRLLSDNFGYFGRLIGSLCLKGSRKLLKGMDLHDCRAFYAVKSGHREIKALMDELPDFRETGNGGEEAAEAGAVEYDWLRLGESKKLEEKMHAAFRHEDGEPGAGFVGKIILTPRLLVFQTFGKQKYAFGKKMLEKYFEDSIVPEKESVVDMAKQMAEDRKQGKEPPTPKPGGEFPLEIKRKLAQDFYKKQYKIFLDDKIPALDGMTPRGASKKPSMRPRLVELMKSHLKNIERQNKKDGFGVDIGWVLDELGLTELK